MIISEQLPLVTSWHANKFCFRTSIQRVLKKKLKKDWKYKLSVSLIENGFEKFVIALFLYTQLMRGF